MTGNMTHDFLQKQIPNKCKILRSVPRGKFSFLRALYLTYSAKMKMIHIHHSLIFQWKHIVVVLCDCFCSSNKLFQANFN